MYTCYYSSGGIRKKNWMDEKLFSLSTAKDLFVHHPESGRRRVLELMDTEKRSTNGTMLYCYVIAGQWAQKEGHYH